jgi:hypothetical protein
MPIQAVVGLSARPNPSDDSRAMTIDVDTVKKA